jgi:ABC-type amino acid transport substrate-binding protein
MKKTFICLFIIIPTFAFCQKYSGDSWAKVKSSGSGTLSIVYNEQFGLIFKVPNGNVSGVCVDIISDFQKYVETKYGKKITVKYVGQEPEFSTFLKVVQTTPNILGVTNTTITEERKKVMKFTPAFMNTQLVLLTNKSAPSIKNLSELPTVFAGFTAEILSGSTHVEHIEKIKKAYHPTLKVTYVPSAENIVKNLSTNAKIFSVLDFTEYIGVVKRRLPVKRQDIEFENSEAVAFIMSRHSDWDEVWNEFLTPEYRQSVRYKEIITKNLGSSFLSLVR